MLTWLAHLGRAGLSFFERLGRGHLFLLQVLAGVPGLLLRPARGRFSRCNLIAA